MSNLTEISAKLNLGIKTLVVQTADVGDIPLPLNTLGTLTPAVQQIMMAQRKKSVNQSADQISISNGIGCMGLNLLQIYDLGLIKPQMFDQFSPSNSNTDSVGLVPPSLNFDEQQVLDALNLSTAWTGQYNVFNLQDLLSRIGLQYILQQDSYILSYNALISSNVINGTEDIEVLAMTVGLTSIYGLPAVAQFLGNQL